MIPRRFVRTVPATVNTEVEHYWAMFKELHPGWEMVTWRDPIDPALFPVTSPLWHHCANGAQLAGLVRLEDLWHRGGFYVDSDVEPYRSFEPLVGLDGVAAWEDENVVPDAVLGASAGHPALQACLTHAMAAVAAGKGAWESGPGATTAVLPGRDDWLLLPPGSFYAVHYRDKKLLDSPAAPWEFCRHRWHASWLSPAQKARMDRMQR